MGKIKLAAGDPAPKFDLARDGGGSISLAGLAGKKVVLYFYPKDATPGCTKEAIDFNGLQNEFQKTDTIVIGVSPDPVKSHDKFRDAHKLGFPLLSDESKAMLEAYGVWTEKSMYGRTYMGVERTTFLIDAKGVIRYKHVRGTEMDKAVEALVKEVKAKG